MKNFPEKSLEERASRQKDRKCNRTRQKNKRGDRKVESNDSPEIPDRGETSDIPGLPSGGMSWIKVLQYTSLERSQKDNVSTNSLKNTKSVLTQIYI